ncbi:MAG: hypothetical protein ABW298_17830 [Candidatus Binatia bacterium]
MTLIARTVTVAAVAAAIAGFALPAIAAEEAAPAPLTSGKVGGTVKVTATVEQIEEAGRRQRGRSGANHLHARAGHFREGSPEEVTGGKIRASV